MSHCYVDCSTESVDQSVVRVTSEIMVITDFLFNLLAAGFRWTTKTRLEVLDSDHKNTNWIIIKQKIIKKSYYVTHLSP